MRRIECLERLAPLITDQLVVVTITGAGVEWRRSSQHEGSMPVGQMAIPTAIGTGLALALPHRTVIVLDGDGSALMDLTCLTTIGIYQPPNLKVFVFDNQVYSGTRISHPSATAFGISLEGMARAACIEEANTVRDLESFEREAKTAVSEPGLRYVVVKVEEDRSAQQKSMVDRQSRMRMDRLESKYQFMRYIERTEAERGGAAASKAS